MEGRATLSGCCQVEEGGDCRAAGLGAEGGASTAGGLGSCAGGATGVVAEGLDEGPGDVRGWWLPDVGSLAGK
mgnify:CR=1 FL=1